MKCSHCGAELDHVNWWENHGAKVYFDSLDIEHTLDTEHTFDCPECGEPISPEENKEIRALEIKLYG